MSVYLISTVNFLAIFLLPFFIGSKKWYKNLIIAILLSVFIIAEIGCYLYFLEPINEQFFFFITNLQIYHILFETKVMVAYFLIYIFIFSVAIFYTILKKFHIKKFKKYFIILFLIILFSPIGFIYNILYSFAVGYIYDYAYYINYDYQELFRLAKNSDYVIKDNLQILNSDEKHKNLVLIYLESYEGSLLTNETISKYTQDIIQFSSEGEFYKNIEQTNGAMGTFAGMFTTLCGVPYFDYSLFFNAYKKVNNNQLVCLSDILNKSGYNNFFIGGADKILFNKGNLLLSHSYNTFEDKHSLLKQYPELRDRLNEWGVADWDIFEIAKEKYIELSKKGKPFNLTILTTATHNANGVKDERCKNTTDNNLLNAVECTNFLVGNFVNFLKTQPNYNDTIVVILPDHIQYELNELKEMTKNDEHNLFVIILNSGKIKEHDSTINYTELAEVILDRLNVKSNATFLNNQDPKIIKNFIHKIHFDNK